MAVTLFLLFAGSMLFWIISKECHDTLQDWKMSGRGKWLLIRRKELKELQAQLEQYVEEANKVDVWVKKCLANTEGAT